MMTFDQVAGILEILEAKAFSELLSEPTMTNECRDAITGKVVFATVDSTYQDSKEGASIRVCTLSQHAIYLYAP